jgi:hypothetical protein
VPMISREVWNLWAISGRYLEVARR